MATFIGKWVKKKLQTRLCHLKHLFQLPQHTECLFTFIIHISSDQNSDILKLPAESKMINTFMLKDRER